MKDLMLLHMGCLLYLSASLNSLKLVSKNSINQRLLAITLVVTSFFLGLYAENLNWFVIKSILTNDRYFTAFEVLVWTHLLLSTVCHLIGMFAWIKVLVLTVSVFLWLLVSVSFQSSVLTFFNFDHNWVGCLILPASLTLFLIFLLRFESNHRDYSDLIFLSFFGWWSFALTTLKLHENQNQWEFSASEPIWKDFASSSIAICILFLFGEWLEKLMIKLISATKNINKQ